MLIKPETQACCELRSPSTSLRLLYCSTDRGSLLVYGGEAHGGKSEAASMPDQGTGRCCGCHRLPEPQIFSRICLGIPDIAVSSEGSDNLLVVFLQLGFISDEMIIYKSEMYQILRRKCFFSNHSFHCLNILPNCIICIELKEEESH